MIKQIYLCACAAEYIPYDTSTNVLGRNIRGLQAQVIDYWCPSSLTHLRSRQNGRRFADDIFKCISLNENVWIPIEISLKFVPQGPIYYTPTLV